MLNRVATVLADWAVRRPAWLLLGGLALLLGSTAFLTLRQNFDTDILNLLPAEEPAVQGLKVYNSDFTQMRELAFLLTWEHPSDQTENQRQEFLDRLRQQPWVVRMLDGSPMEGANPSAEIGAMAVPLLLNLSPERLHEALESLQPDALTKRLDLLANQTLAGSPRARFELESDPFGLVGRAAQPIWETASIGETFDLTLPDESAMIVPVVTNQPDGSAPACHALMAEVRKFIAETEATLGPEGPRIQVTGRSAYVDEIANSMQRDIMLTSTVSLCMVIGLFWFGFRQVLPLVGISLILGLTATVSMALGVGVFNQLNIVAISFCSILFGLGDDFSLLLCQHFYQAQADGADRRTAIKKAITHCLPGLLWVAVTTGTGFLSLCLSGSSGFAQLGFLVAVGLLLCALFMPLFLFPFLGSAPKRSSATGPAAWLAEKCYRQPRQLLGAGLLVFVLLAAAAILPGRFLRFDLSPSSLEPKNTPAAITLSTMMGKFPAMFEPVMIVLPEPTAAQLTALDGVLQRLKDRGEIVSFSSPSGLVLDRERRNKNRQALSSVDWPAAHAAAQSVAAKYDLRPFTQGEALLTQLEKEATSTGQPAWKDVLPPSSLWWFLIDRSLAPASDSVIAFARTPPEITAEQRVALSREINAAVPEALVTGWSQALAGLVPWAKRELAVFGSAVGAIVLLILAFVYRDLRLWSLHAFSILAALAGTAATLILLDLPLNLLNVLALPLMIGVGVDYGTHLILAARQSDVNLAGTIKAVTLSGLTTATGFGALVLAKNPALSGLGAICAVGVLWCLFFSLLIVAPSTAAITGLQPRASGDTNKPS